MNPEYGWANYVLQAKSSPPPAFIKKVTNGHTHLFIYGCFYMVSAELSRCDREQWPCKAKNTIWFFFQKKFANSSFRAFERTH